MPSLVFFGWNIHFSNQKFFRGPWSGSKRNQRCLQRKSASKTARYNILFNNNPPLSISNDLKKGGGYYLITLWKLQKIQEWNRFLQPKYAKFFLGAPPPNPRFLKLFVSCPTEFHIIIEGMILLMFYEVIIM